MQMLFSKKEMEYIDTSELGWKPKKNCPENIKKKLQILMQYGKDVINGKQRN